MYIPDARASADDSTMSGLVFRNKYADTCSLDEARRLVAELAKPYRVSLNQEEVRDGKNSQRRVLESVREKAVNDAQSQRCVSGGDATKCVRVRALSKEGQKEACVSGDECRRFE